jgi:RNA polymerase sigma-70 factor (ECF subfamily)
MDPSSPSSERFARIVDSQRSLYAYILKLLPHSSDAKDVLQETNLVLMSKLPEEGEIRSFNAWAARVAYYQVLAHLSRKKRDRMYFSEELMRGLADEAESTISDEDPWLRALGVCLERLPTKDRTLVEKRYRDDLPARRIAAQVQRSARAVSQALYRVRLSLMDCVRDVLAMETAK